MSFDVSVLSALSETLRGGEIFLRLDRTSEADPVKGYVPACRFKICRIEGGGELGRIGLRFGHNRSTAFGGNVGYEVHEPSRRTCLYAGARLTDVVDIPEWHELYAR